MKSLRAVVHHDRATLDPKHAFVCESPAVDRFVVLEGRPHEGVETVLCHVEGDREAFEAAMVEADGPMEYDVTPDGDDGFFLYLRQSLGERGESIVEALSRETVVVASPIEFRPDRTMRLTLVGHADELGAALDALPEGMTAEVLRVGDYATAVGAGLTARQREALAAAWAVGYYELPREAGIEAVADELDCVASTASDLLRRAEARLVGDALGEPR
jgi:hypothetical protein